MKISPQWGRMHQDVIKIVTNTSLKLSKEATCSNHTHICEVLLRCSLDGMEEMKGERNEFQSDGAESHHQHGLDLGVFGVQVILFLIKNALWLYAEFVSPNRAGSTFSEKS